MMVWEVHDARLAFAQFAADWDRLNGELFGNHPFFDSRFVGPLLNHFAVGNEKLCVHRRDGRISGALILQPQGRGRWTSFRPSQAQITAVLLDDVIHLRELIRTLPGFAWTIELFAVDPRYAPRLPAASQNVLESAQAYTIGISGGLAFEDYWGKRSKNLRANLRRYVNRLNQEFGDFRLDRYTLPEGMDAAVHRFATLESAGWKGKAGTAIAPGNDQEAFYAEIMRAFAAAGKATVYELVVGDRLAASRLMVENDGMSIILKTTYDEELSRIAPGRVQLNRVIEDRLIQKPGQTVEFYTNATRDQREWATFGCTILNLQVFRSPVYSGAFVVLKGLRNSLGAPSTADDSAESVEIGVSPDIESLRQTGLNLANLSRENSLEANVDWFGLLQRTVFSRTADTRYYYAASDKQVSALLPVRFTRSKGIKSIEALSNFYTSLFSPLKADDADSVSLKHLLARAAQDLTGAHSMRFAPMDPNSREFHELHDHLLNIGWVPFRFFCFGNWYLRIEKDWANYLRHRSANLRSRIKRKTRRFMVEGGTLEVVVEPDRVADAIAAFQEVYSASWKIPEPYPEFIPALIRHLAELGALRMGIAWLGGCPIAAQLWILTGNKASIYKVAYHEAYAAYSPGTVLTAHLLQHVIDHDKVVEVDFLIGDDEYKKMWMSNRRERWGIVAYNPRRPLGFAMIAVETFAHMMGSVRNRFRRHWLAAPKARTSP